jgi:hypothetical protein
VVREVDRLDEISIVARPRDPLARFEAVEIPAQAVAALPGSDAPDGVLECQRCVRVSRRWRRHWASPRHATALRRDAAKVDHWE